MNRFALGLATAAVMGAGMAANAALPVTGGLVCWYDAGVGVLTDGGVIRTWNDQSGNGHHGTVGGGSTVLAEDQIDSKPAARFRGSYLDLDGSLFVKEQYLVLRSPTATWSGGGGFLCRAEGRGSTYDMRDGDVTFWPDQAPDAVSRNGTPVLVEGCDNSQYVLQPLTSFMILKIVVNDNATSEASYQIGRAETGTVDFDVAEIIGYDRTLSAEEEASMGSYLADKYDLITAYPAVTPQAKILSFGLPGMPAVIDQSERTISWTVPGGTAVTNLAPEFTLSDGATCDHVSGTKYNFTSPVNYIVTPSVGAPRTYTVTVPVDAQLSALPVTSGLVCWYDAGVGVATDGDGVIQTWNDLSGQGHHAKPISRDKSITDMTVLEQDQLDLKPAAHFMGAYLSLDDPYFTAREQYVVVRSTIPTWSGGGAILGRRGDIGERSYYLQGGTTKFWGDPWPAAVSKNGGESLPRNESGNLGYDLDPITSFMLLKIDMGNIGVGTYQIGRTGDGLLKDFYVAEIVGYDSLLSSEDENLLGSYFASKYGLPVVPITSFANILTFDFGWPYGLATISGNDISITVPFGTDVTTLAPTYTLSTGATCDKDNGFTQDFTGPVTYTVTSSDLLITKAYVVSVTVTPASPACDILTFGLPGMPAVITGNEIAWTVPAGTDVTNLAPEYTVSPLASEDPLYPSGTPRDFTFPVTYTIMAADGSTQEYTVTVTVAASRTLFRRGDADGSGKLDLTDAITTLQFLFMGGTPPACKDAADTDDSGKLDLTDAISSLQFQFMGGPPPAAPGPTTCGPDPTLDEYTECIYPNC